MKNKQTEISTEISRIKISGLTHDGVGVGRIDGKVVFVPRALPGEEVLAAVSAGKKGILRGRMLELLAPSAERAEPVCEAYDSCGGCRLQHLSYAAQLRSKEQTVRDALLRLGGLRDVDVKPTLGMAEPWRYRNKGHFQVKKLERRIRLGFFEEESHQLAGQSCRYLFSERVVALLSFLEELLSANNVMTATPQQKGLCRIMVRESRASGELLLVFITNGRELEEAASISREISDNFPNLAGIVLSSRADLSGPVLGRETAVIWGRGEITDRLGPYSFSISAPSFFQINNDQAEALFNKAVEYAGLSGNETVIDAYCGIGAISMFLAEKAARVIGIEAVSEAVEDARKNALSNEIRNMEFLTGEAERIMPRLVQEGLKPDVVVVDPPRKGCAGSLLESIIDVRPIRVVYVSCDPATLARDLRILTDGGYLVREVQPVDMFPQTSHVECVIGMQRKDT